MPAGRSSRRRKIVAAALGLIGALLVAELVCRIDRLFPGQQYSAGSMRTFLEDRAASANYGDLVEYAAAQAGVDPSEHRLVPDPWSAWTSPSQIQRIAQGTRWFRGGEHANVFDVVLVGGSFAAQFGNANQQRLLDWLAQLPAVGSRPVTIWNLSHAAHKQPAHLHRVTFVLALGWKPDLVVCIDGFNDLALSAENAQSGVSPVYPSAGWWANMARGGAIDTQALDLLVELRTAQVRVAEQARAGLRWGVWRSALLSRVWIARLAESQARFREARERHRSWQGAEGAQIAVRGPIDPGEPAQPGPILAGAAAGLVAWTDAARNLQAICDAHGVPLVHALQPGLDDEGSKPPSAEEERTRDARPSWRTSIRLGYPGLRRSIDELARAGVTVRDGSRIFADREETLFVDVCHLNDRGYELFGLQVVEWVRAALESR
jgi:hypothetical protein